MSERTGNVYENKGPAQKSTTPSPSLSKERDSGLPPRMRRGWGWCDFGYTTPWRETGFVVLKNRRNKARMSMKTNDNGRKSRSGADVALGRLRYAEGAVGSNWTALPDLSLRDIADPTSSGSAPA